MMIEKLAKVFKDVFGVERFDDSLCIQTVEEWDSVGHVNLLLELEVAFGIELGSAVWEGDGMFSVEDIVSTLRRLGVE